MTMTTKQITSTNTGYAVKLLDQQHMQSAADLFIKTFCDYEPITKHLGITYNEYEPFAMAVIQKAVKDGLSVIVVDKNDRVIGCAIGEDITDLFKPDLTMYPKMKPILALIEELSKSFLSKKFKKGKMAHTWLAMVDKQYQGQGISTDLDLACTQYIASKGYDFTYAEFTNAISENIVHYYPVSKKINEIYYDHFTYEGTYPFKTVQGSTASYVLGIKKGVKIESLQNCYA